MRALAATRDTDAVRTRHHRFLMLLVYLVAVVAATTVSAQSKKPDPKLKPRPVTLKTKDGISLRAYYFPSEKGKEAPTVLLVYGWRGNAGPYQRMAEALRDAGCAVLIPDYRGHGSSKEYINARGQNDKFDISRMSKRDVENIISYDLEKAKAFLKDENNEENLNLNALIVIGVREGCVMAAHWASRDWGFPSLGSVKQGQDVKALVLVSPRKQIKGIAIDPALKDANLLRLPIMIIAGEKSPEAAEAKRIAKRIESTKKRIGRGDASGFSLKMIETNLSGPLMVKKFPAVVSSIGTFIKTQVKTGKDGYPWVDRQ